MDPNAPVTVVVRHRVKPGREAAYEEWQRGINQASMKFPGHLGYHIIRPANPRGQYLILFRFDSLANLETWESSDTRREWLASLELLTMEAPTRERHTGMEVWFTPLAGRTAPSRLKMVVVTFLALYPLISLSNAFLVPTLLTWPFLLRTATTTILLIFLMTYAAMPLATYLLSRWLYPGE